MLSIGQLTVGSVDTIADDTVMVDKVLSAWRNRQERVKTFRFRWVEDRFQAKGSLRLPPDLQNQGDPFPPKDMTYRTQSRCEMNQEMMRYGVDGESLQFYNRGPLEHREYVSASDGEISKAFWPYPNKLRNYPKGIIFDEKVCTDATTLDIKPLLWLYRGMDPRFAFHDTTIYKMKLFSAADILDGRTCVVVGYIKGDTEISIWVDPLRDFVPLRYTSKSNVTGKVTTQVDITYRQDPMHGWTPILWRMVQPGTGSPCFSINARVVESAINVEIPKSRFQIEFSPGTIVEDLRSSQRYRVGEDGSKQPLAH